MMAGGHLEAVFDDGGVHASFKLGCDTLIARQPYHCAIRACVDIGGSNTFDLIGTHTMSIDLGADRHIGAPDVAGIARSGPAPPRLPGRPASNPACRSPTPGSLLPSSMGGFRDEVQHRDGSGIRLMRNSKRRCPGEATAVFAPRSGTGLPL